ncbi:MAG TPA: hypothetical protein PLA65_06215 [Spirochaetota bacterium]|nr:hypothetical protein [Spirochaetota bacterium]HOD13325.1 hypothetical protein [Spirochaetota bacterium]HPG49613.1 hypothetical protein [Spirochaetota bacterium]HPN11634.1 hypothetical protein [Spirochaetota bacterium]HQL37892.1 hypothetical protein [Anaerolineaceae bacterium]
MRVLRAVFPFIALALALVSCSPQAAVTPRGAFNDLREAVRAGDAAALERQLTTASLARMREAAALFSRMEDRQVEALSEKLGVDAQRLRRLSVRDYCALTLAAGGERNVIRVAARQEIVGVSRKGARAVIRVSNGMELHFVKEGPYWKFDMTLL